MKHLAILVVLALGSFAAPSAWAFRIPQSTNEYYFTRIPAPEFVAFSRNRSSTASSNHDLLECYPTFTDTSGDVKIYGYVKQYPINGKPLNDKLLRHETCAYLSEPINERKYIDSKSIGGLLTTTCRDKNILVSPDLSFTNKYLKVAPSYNGEPIVYNDISNPEFGPDNHYKFFSDMGISLAHPDFNYNKPDCTGKAIYLVGTYDRWLTAFNNFRSAIWYNEWLLSSGGLCAKFTCNRTEYSYDGSYPSGNWSNNNVFTPYETSTPATPYEDDWETSNFSINWSYYHDRHRQWYLSNWSDTAHKFMSSTEGLSTEQESIDLTDVEDEFAYIDTGCPTNNILKGGINRAVAEDMFCTHWFHITYYKEKNDVKVEDFEKLVIIADKPTSLNLAGDVGCDDDDNCWPDTTNLVMKPGKTIREMAMDALEACGLEWKQKVYADTPEPFSEDDLPRLSTGPDWSHKHSGYHTTHANLYMCVQYVGCSLATFRVNFTSP